MATVNAANRLPLLVAVVVLLLAAIVGVVVLSGRSDGEGGLLSRLPRAPGADADTPAETINSLVGELENMRDKTTATDGENRRMRTELNGMTRQLAAYRQQITDLKALQRSDEQLTNQVETVTDTLARVLGEMDLLKSARATEPGQPLKGLGVEDDLPVNLAEPPAITAPVTPAIPDIIWVAPVGATAPNTTNAAATPGRGPKAPGLLTRAGDLFDTPETPSSVQAGSTDRSVRSSRGSGEVTHPTGDDAEFVRTAAAVDNAEAVTPRYTIPPDSKLISGTLWTALLGRIPVNGQVSDPWRFSILTGAENLAARGIHIPNLEGVVWSGVARGDLLLRCVSGNLTSVTFIFEDGRIVNHRGTDAAPLGYISDNQGIPCVSGRLITNAPAYLTGTGLLAAAGAGASALSAGETTSVVSSAGTINSAVDGSTGRYLLGEAAAGAADNAIQWLQDRAQSSFDVVYVEPGGDVAINVEAMLPIDYDTQGRKVAYHNEAPDPYRTTSLD